jgi:penicillin-binding protein 1C
MSDSRKSPDDDVRERFRRILTEFQEAEEGEQNQGPPTQPTPKDVSTDRISGPEEGGDPPEGELPDEIESAEESVSTDASTAGVLSEAVTQAWEPTDRRDLDLDNAETQPLILDASQPSEPESKTAGAAEPSVLTENTSSETQSFTSAATRPFVEPEIKKEDTHPTAAARAVQLKSTRTGVTTRPTKPQPSATYSAARTRPAQAPARPASMGSQPVVSPAPPGPPAAARPRGGSGRSIDWRTGLGCLLRMFILGIFGLIVVVIAAASVGVYQYYRIRSTLPDVANLRTNAAQFETTRIYDRNDNVLYEVLDPNAGRRTYVPLEKISPYLLAATIATEDKDFYTHPGFNPLAIARAFIQNYTSGEIVSGASTITQQLARNLLFTPEERYQQSYQRKIREAILAMEITRNYSRGEILELYLNDSNYGNLAYGVEAAAETYFGTTADKLTLAESAFLAGLPQAPSVYDVYANREVTLARTEQVLSLLVQTSQEQGCIYVSNNTQPLCIDVVQAVEAANAISNYDFNNPDVPLRYPHWVNFVREQLETLFDPQTIYRSGFSVYTTLDPGMQDTAEQIVREQVAALAANRASNGALVAIRPASGEILAMVGSADFYNVDIDGQVNMAISPRQPGSSIKPLTYLSAFEQGWTPATLIWDVPSEFPPSGREDDLRPPYQPVNYDRRFHGPVTVRAALANSFNVPAVKALDFVGIYDDPFTPEKDGLIATAERLGIDTLTRNDYGLALTLGGGDVSLLQLTGAYATLANAGRRVPPFAITRIVDHVGNVVYEHQPPLGEQIVRAEHAYLISSILSDNEGRAPMFGRNSVLNLPFQAAVKTGTTDDFRDNWTLGYTPDITIGVWVGNADYTPMQNTTGLTGAAPIWADMMQAAIQQLTGGNPAAFARPVGVVDRVICAVSGTVPSEWCPEQTNELFAADQPPLPADQDLWTEVVIDTYTGLRASAACSEFSDRAFALNVTDPWAIRWITENAEGRAWAESLGFDDELVFVPERECEESDPRPVIEFSAPREGERISSTPLEIYARVGATGDFRRWWLEWGPGDNPVKWELLERSGRGYAQPDNIYAWDVSEIPAGVITLRLRVESTEGRFAEKRILLNMQIPTPTPTPTSTATPTPTSTMTPTPTNTPVPSSTPTITPSPIHSATPTPGITVTVRPIITTVVTPGP